MKLKVLWDLRWSNGTLLNSAPYFNVTGQTFSSFGSINIEFDTDGSVGRTLDWSVYCDMVLGCMDTTGCDYNPAATLAGACDFSCYGCTAVSYTHLTLPTKA